MSEGGPKVKKTEQNCVGFHHQCLVIESQVMEEGLLLHIYQGKGFFFFSWYIRLLANVKQLSYVFTVYVFCVFWLENKVTLGFSSVQSLSRVWLFVTPWIAARQASLSITNSRSLPKLCPSIRWCHPAISSSVVPFSSCPQSLPASESFPIVNSSCEVAKVLEFQL